MTLRNAIYGLAVGDAVGVPYEFLVRGSFVASEQMVGGGAHGQPAGTFSDDTSMTLATCASLKEKRCVDLADIRHRFEDWAWRGEYAVDRNVFDIGCTVSRALDQREGQTGEQDNGNGSLMRIIPLAFFDVSDDEVRDVSSITHAHETSTELCVRYIQIARKLIGGMSIKDVIAECEPTIFEMNREDIKSGGYVADTYVAALWCLANNDSYSDTVLEAVSLGGDTDTTASVAGALAGIIYGIEGIPAHWLDGLKGKDIIENCL